ncbi:hypothetical protein IFM89_014511 [Coptis chinensis]|uniref:Endonuclease/exonuclease/phosphatase domain-containing protein n=1 Tax=Coptis chinensis TaxID=261450 RepID=A0A835LLI7_9MAGN|nr:hypothetical protein IFM89_014511 [Coptis chinensis]
MYAQLVEEGEELEDDLSELEEELFGDSSSAPMFKFTVVYASNARAERLCLWEEISALHYNLTTPSCVMGDFNNVLLSSERIGRDPVHPRETVPFARCLNDSGLYDHQAT